MKDTYRITNLNTPMDGKDAVRKEYVDNTFIDRDGSYSMKGNLKMGNNKIINLKEPTDNSDGSTKKCVDDTVSANKLNDSSFFKLDGTRKMIGNIDMNNNRIFNLPMPNGNNQPTTLIYSNSNYLRINGSIPMMGDLNMNGRKIKNVKLPTNKSDGANKKYVDDNTISPDLSDYLERDGTVDMTGNLNLGNNKIINLATPTANTDAATKKYVDDNRGISDLSGYLKKDGSVDMTGDLNLNDHKITNLSKPLLKSEATNKEYVDNLVNHLVQPSHYNNQFAYLMSSAAQWTDEIDTGTSFFIKRIGDLEPNKGNFHNYNRKVIYMGINKNSQGGYKYKMGINFYRLTANTDYTLCLEILNTDYQLWHKSQISVDKGTSKGLSIGNVSVRKLSHRYSDSKGQTQFMYYHRIIVNFRKLSSGNKFFLHILVNIPQDGTDLAVYPRQFLGVYLITYGIVGTFSNIDPDKVYDYHTAFDIKPTEVVYNVDINANNKKILNINLDRNINNSAATVGMVKEIHPFTTHNLYRNYFKEVYDFTNAANYKLSRTASGIVFNNLASTSGNTLSDMGIPNRTIDDIKKEGLDVTGYTISFSPPIGITKYTLCIVFYHWRNRNFSIKKNNLNIGTLLNLNYTTKDNTLSLVINNVKNQLTMLNEFDGKKIVIWLVENFNSNITKVKISNYSAILSLPIVRYTNNQRFEFTTEDGVLSKIMFSPNYYDTDSEQYHKVMLQEKLNGTYVL